MVGKRRARHEPDKVLEYLKRFQFANMRMPTYKEAVHDLKISYHPLYRILAGLAVNGKLRKVIIGMPYRIR